MADDAFENIGYLFKIDEDETLEFKKLYGFTFVFKKRIIAFHCNISSAEIRPLGIIYDENGEYYFAPLEGPVNVSDVVCAYVDNCILK